MVAPAAGGLLLFKLWVAKKVAVLAAIRAFRNQTSLSTEREVSGLFRHARENARKVEEHRAQNSAHDHAV